MDCGTCLRFKRLTPRPGMSPRALRRWKTRYGRCRWPGFKPAPYWHAEHPGGDLLVAEVHGTACPAFKERRR